MNGRRLYYEVGGEGETVVLLHGAFANADLLEAPATAISSGFRAIRYDRRGHGRSGEASEPLPLAEEAAELAAFLDWLSTEKTHVLAHDDGAEIALQFALDFPERTLSLALLAPTLEGFAWRDETRAARRDLLAAYARNPQHAIAERWLPSRIFDVAREHET
ncbi:MAG: alpha/beta fold hydrolase, partial [Acidobacteriota bacterium]